MKDEHREKLDNRLTPLELYKLTPRTNCGECGFATCLAFATQVIVGQADIEGCPYLDQGAIEPFRSRLAEQHKSGIGLKREGFEKALQFLREEVKKWDFMSIAASLGAAAVETSDGVSLELEYFGDEVLVTPHDITRSSGEDLDAWEKILVYNYVIGGATEPSGVWVGMESLPNSVSKVKSLKNHCESPLAEAFAGKMDRLSSLHAQWLQKLLLEDKKTDFAAEFKILPMLSIRILFWDEDPAEGFPAHVKFLFDSRVLQVLDLESLVFTCEKLKDRLLDWRREKDSDSIGK